MKKKFMLRKEQKRQEEIALINGYISDLKNKGEIIAFINQNINPLYQSFSSLSGRELIKLFEQESFINNTPKILGEMKTTALIIGLLYSNELTGYIPEVLACDGVDAVDKIKNYFKGYPDLDYLLNNVRILEDTFNLKVKIANALYSSALNVVNTTKREELLAKALKEAPWGSVISLRIVKVLILLKAGALEKGKKIKSLRMEVANRRHQLEG
jgi:hypothetical protein